MHILRALLYLRFYTLRNALARRFQRLRQPKYLAGAIVGIAYFWFFFFRGVGGSGRPGPAQALALVFGGDRAEIAAAVLLTLYFLLTWVSPSDQPGLTFTEAEVSFLFPAPLTRRQLIHYKLLNGLLITLISAMFFALMSGGLRYGWRGGLRYLGAWWALNANLSLHSTMASLVIMRLSNFGLRARWRRILLLGGAAVLLAGGIIFIEERGPESLSWVLWPARLVVRPYLAHGLTQYLLALAPAGGIALLHYWCVLRLELPFEDASIVQAKRVSETVARIRAGKGISLTGAKTRARRPPFRLGARLPREFAFLWKNLMLTPSYFNRTTFLVSAALAAVGLTWLKHQDNLGGAHLASAAGFIALSFLAWVLAFGPQLARFDLRRDLANADLLKAYPLPGWRIVLGQLLAPAVLLTGIAWVLLLVAMIGVSVPPDRADWLTPGFKLAVGLAGAIIIPPLCALQLLMPNAAALFFPAWAQNNRNAGGGLDVMGQRLIFTFGQLACMLVALAPVAITGAFVVGGFGFLPDATKFLFGIELFRMPLPGSIAIAAVPVVLVLLAEIWFGVRLLGPRFEKLDIAAELRP